MKEKLFELLEQAQAECSDCCDCDYSGLDLCANHKLVDGLIKRGVTITREEDLKRTASRNYEAEYHELLHKHNLLYSDHQAMESEFARMRAQLDIVYLIFGGK